MGPAKLDKQGGLFIIKKSITPSSPGDWLQVLLLFSSLSYLFGYIIWTLYAYRCTLGFMPILKEQYLIAGIIPLVILSVVLLCIKAAKDFLQSIMFPLLSTKSSARMLMAILLPGAILLSINLVLFASPSNLLLAILEATALSSIILPIMSLGIYLVVKNHSSHTHLIFGIGFRVGFVISLMSGAVYFFLAYAFTFFPKIPPEFGGPRCQTVKLAVKKEFLSPRIRYILLGANDMRDTSALVNTKVVRILLYSDDFVFIQSEHSVLKLKKEAIGAIYLRGQTGQNEAFSPADYDGTEDLLQNLSDQTVNVKDTVP